MKKLIEKYFKRGSEHENDEKYNISLEELKRLKADGAIIIDVRSPQEYNEGHISGSISIPEYEMKKNAENLLENKEENIIVYCSSGTRSREAQKILQKLGYTNVYNLITPYP